jgi:hypothetical protein
MATKIRRDWTKLDPLIDNLKAQGWNDTQIAKDLGIGRQTLVDHLRSRDTTSTPTAHPGTPEHSGIPKEDLDVSESAHPSTPERTEISDDQYTQEHPSTFPDADHTEVHHGTLEGHQDVMEEVHQSVPDAPHIGTPKHTRSTPGSESTALNCSTLRSTRASGPSHQHTHGTPWNTL